ncbi:YaaA family protein [Campylobacter mucosalis]|uniref:Putative DUF328 domain protein n=1 Tax=Campylobacter mucosalis CCUG 21559 TaxID=1032067 RepID=A0A6G5QH42_9BACT|nr:peroxide stress protein YaaA [Campylobacter mucosalis]QCD44952.1 putative DUF328 domain protein [Campylobacter mucosalis CCUG 21559]
MKILFSPSEAKRQECGKDIICLEKFIFPELSSHRLRALKIYDDFIANSDDSLICKLFGLKDFNPSLKQSIFKKGCIKAIKRYTGVAYNALNYDSLDKNTQNFIDDNTLIFSNLFGVIRASDLIPEYKLKQGERIGDFNLELFFKQNFSKHIDDFLKDEILVDLRAEFYKKFYEIKQEYLTFKFVKNKKIVSHYAKAYRGKILRELALKNAKTKDEILALNFTEATLVQIQKIGLKTELVLEIS